MKLKTLNDAILISAFILVALLSYLGLYTVINLFVLFLCGSLLLKNRKLLILIYIITLPTNGFISTEYNLFGVLHTSYTINLFALFAVYFEWKFLSKDSIKYIRHVNSFKKYAIWLALFLFMYLLLTGYRLSFLGMQEISSKLLFTRTIRYFVMFMPLLLLIKLSHLEKYQRLITRGVLISIGLIAISIIFSEYFYQIGLATQETDKYLRAAREANIRKAGIFRLGDVNSAAGFMAVSFAFILFSTHLNVSNMIKNILLCLIILATILTGSRTGFISLASVLIMYFLSGDRALINKIKYIIFIFLISAILMATDYLVPLLSRFSELQIGEGHLDPGRDRGRLGGWLFYMEYIFSDMKILLWGTTQSIYHAVGWFTITSERVAHNFYIQLLYYWGIIPFIIFISILAKYVLYSLRLDAKYTLISLFIPFVLTLMFVSDTGVFLGIIMSLMAIKYDRKRT